MIEEKLFCALLIKLSEYYDNLPETGKDEYILNIIIKSILLYNTDPSDKRNEFILLLVKELTLVLLNKGYKLEELMEYEETEEITITDEI